MRPLFLAVSTLAGTIIGAGILAIPFVIHSAVFLSNLQYADHPATTTSAFSKQLTATEQLVFELLLNGCQDREIAEKLYISQYTVKFHVRNILRKAKARNRYELLAIITSKVRSEL